MSENITSHPLVLVTGAAHRLGREIALSLANQGFSIGLHYHSSQDAAVQTAAQIEAIGSPAHLLQADLRDPQQINQLFETIASLPYKLSGLVNSAAIMPVSRLDQSGVDIWDEIFSLNLRAAWLCSQKAAKLIMPGSGWIINISDAGINKAWMNYAIYNLSKASLQHLTRLLARTYAPFIRVNAIAPGFVLRNQEILDEDWQRMKRRLPLQESGQLQDIGQAAIFLINQSAITGQTITIDGGYQLV